MIFRAADFRTWKTPSTERVIFVCFRVQTKKPRDIYTERKQTHNIRTAERFYPYLRGVADTNKRREECRLT